MTVKNGVVTHAVKVNVAGSAFYGVLLVGADAEAVYKGAGYVSSGMSIVTIPPPVVAALPLVTQIVAAVLD